MATEDDRDMTYAERLWPVKVVAATPEAELRRALFEVGAVASLTPGAARYMVLHNAITELVALRADVARLSQHERDDEREIGELTLLNAELRAALAEAEARAARDPVADDYPSAVFGELWRVLGELRAATGEEGRA